MRALSDRQPATNCHVLPPYAQRLPGLRGYRLETPPVYRASDYQDWPTMPASVMERIVQPEDYLMSSDDQERMYGSGSNSGDPVADYASGSRDQYNILAEEHALLRLPHLTGAFAARQQLGPKVRKTPLVDGSALAPTKQAQVLLKLENQQYQKSFKVRGAAYAIGQLAPEQLRRGVVTASAGNHGQGVARAARDAGVEATVYVPLGASPIKLQMIQELGARVIRSGETVDDSLQHCLADLRQQPGRAFIHPFDDAAVMQGQSSLAAELITQAPDIERVYLPVGGGGLISANAAALKEYNPDIQVIGVQAEGSTSAGRSKLTGRLEAAEAVNRICDGTAVKLLGKHCLDYVIRYVDEVRTIDNRQMLEAAEAYESAHDDAIEAAAALALAAVRQDAGSLKGTAVVLLSGGNGSAASIRAAMARCQSTAA